MSFIITPTDPLAIAIPDRERELFRAMAELCMRAEMSPQQVVSIAFNFISHAVRQSYATRAQAEQAYDEIVGRMKVVLLDQHFDAVTGRRRSNFAWDQTIDLPHLKLPDKY